MDEPNWLEIAQRHMEEKIIEGTGDSILPALIVRKDNESCLFLYCADPRLLAGISKIAVSGFEADELIFVVDTHYTHSLTNPEGKEWEQDEMQNRQQEPAVRALIKEALLLSRVKRGESTVEMQIKTYERIPGQILWGTDPKVEEKPAANPIGLIPDLLIEGVNAQYLIEAGLKFQTAGFAFGTREDIKQAYGMEDDHELRLHTRLATIRFLAERCRAHHQTLGIAMPLEKAEDKVAATHSLKDVAGMDFEITDAED